MLLIAAARLVTTTRLITTLTGLTRLVTATGLIATLTGLARLVTATGLTRLIATFGTLYALSIIGFVRLIATTGLITALRTVVVSTIIIPGTVTSLLGSAALKTGTESFGTETTLIVVLLKSRTGRCMYTGTW